MAQLQLTGVTGSLTVYGMISGSGTISGSNINAAGNITAATFTGGGSGLTGVVAGSTSAALTAGTGLSSTGTFNGSTARTFAVSIVSKALGGFNKDISAFTTGIPYFDGSGVAQNTSGTGLVYVTATGAAIWGAEEGVGSLVAIGADNEPTNSIIRDDGTTAAVGGLVDAAYKFKVHGNLGVTGTVYETSTIKVKENIETLTDEMSKLLQVRPVEFDYIENGEHSYGFIAQELNDIYPDAVIKDENGETIGVAYADLTSPIIRGIQQLYEKITQLEERIKILEGNN